MMFCRLPILLLNLLAAGSHAFQAGLISTSRPATVLKAVEEQQDDARRTFVATSMAAAASLFVPQTPPALAAGSVDYKAVASDIMDLVQKNPDWGPTLVRCEKQSCV
jgi:hypothetical protein